MHQFLKKENTYRPPKFPSDPLFWQNKCKNTYNASFAASIVAGKEGDWNREEMGDYVRSYSISQFQKTHAFPEVRQ